MNLASRDPIHPQPAILEKFLQDQLLDAESDQVNLHVEKCSSCQAQLEQLCEGSGIQLLSMNEIRLYSDPAQLAADTDCHASGDMPSTDDSSKVPRSEFAFNGTDRYTIQDEIARGGMGVVYRAYDNELDRMLAIKIISNEGQGSGTDAEFRFQREATICGQLQHPGVVPIHELGQLADGRLFIAMKLVVGVTMKKFLATDDSTSQNQSQLLEIFSQICQTMAYAHSKGIVHRDLKPENVMVGSFGEVQIMDWGLAKWVDGSSTENTQTSESEVGSTQAKSKSPHTTATGAVMGTPAYMSPEQALGVQTDQRSDVFSLGGILCEILTGEPPFHAISTTRAFSLAMTSDLSRAKSQLRQTNADPELLQLANECLADNALDRPKDAGEVSRRIDGFLHSQRDRRREAEHLTVRSEAMLAVEKKRRKQVMFLASLILAATTVCTVACLLYSNERNSRQTERLINQQKESAEITKVETQIRGLLGKATTFQKKAEVADVDHQKDLWNDALIPIKQADALITPSVDSDLTSHVLDTKVRIEKGVLAADRFVVQKMRERKLSKAIEVARRISFSIEFERDNLERESDLNQLESAFCEFGIQTGDDLKTVKKAILNSDIKEEIIDGLLSWEKLVVNVRKSNPDKKWFSRVWQSVDKNEIRKKLRRRIEKDNLNLASITTRIEAAKNMVSARMMIDELSRLKETEKLTIFLRSVHRRHPESFEVNLRLGIHNQNLGRKSNLEDAKAHYMACRAIRPTHPTPMLRIAAVHETNRSFYAAVMENLEVREFLTNDTIAYANLARIFQRGWNFPESIKACESGLEIEPDNQEILHTKGGTLLLMKRFTEARGIFQKLINLNSNDSQAHMQLALTYALIDDVAMAEELLNEIPVECRNDFSYIYAKAECLAASGKQEESFKEYDHLLKQYSKDDRTYCNYSSALIQAGSPEQALKFLKRNKKRFKDKNLFYRMLSNALEATEDYAGARAALKELVLKLPPEQELRDRCRNLDKLASKAKDQKKVQR